MKVPASVIFVVIILFSPCASCAANSKVIVIPFENGSEELEGMGDKLTDVVIEQVKKSDKYTYVSAHELFKNWFGGKEEKLKDAFGDETAEAIKESITVLKTFRPMFAHDSLGTIFEYKEHWGIDLIIIGDIKRKNGFLQIDLEIISIDTGRFYSVSNDCRPEKMKDTMRKQVESALRKGEEVQTVEADKEIDHLMSIVSYNIQTLNGESIQIDADFTYERPDPNLQSLNIVPTQSLKEGMKVYKLQTKQEKPIEFRCFYKDGQLENIVIYTSSPSAAEDIEYIEVLSMVSRGGYIINFTFSWKGETLETVRAEPLINPYCEVK